MNISKDEISGFLIKRVILCGNAVFFKVVIE